MTTVAMIFGMLPIALASGDGAEVKNGMAWVIIGGTTDQLVDPESTLCERRPCWVRRLPLQRCTTSHYPRRPTPEHGGYSEPAGWLTYNDVSTVVGATVEQGTPGNPGAFHAVLTTREATGGGIPIHGWISAGTDDLAFAGEVGLPERTRAHLHVFPSPAANSLHIASSGSGELRLFDASGREVLRSRITGTTATLDVSLLPAGFYTYRFLTNDDGSSVVGRWVKE
jgi:hypothetical protein